MNGTTSTHRPFLPARPVRPERCSKRLVIPGQIGMNDQRQIGQVEPASRHIGRDQHARAAIAQGLQGVQALALRQLAGQGNGGKSALLQPALHALDVFARGAEDQRRACLMEAQDIDNGVLDIAGHHAHGLVFDIGVLLVAARGLDAQTVALEALRQRFDLARHRRREHQRLPALRRLAENEFEILAKAQIEHLVGLVEHGHFQVRQDQPAALEMIAQASRRADDDVRALDQQAGLGARVHATDAGHDTGAGLGIEPGQLALHLQGQLTGRGDDQGLRRAGRLEALGFAKQGAGHGKPKCHRLARAGLGGHQQVARGRIFGEHGQAARRSARVVPRAASARAQAPDVWSEMSWSRGGFSSTGGDAGSHNGKARTAVAKEL